MKKYSQLDPKWNRETLGKTIYTIGNWGCTITSICSLISKVNEKSELTPAKAAKTFKFDSLGRLIWGSTKFPGISFVKRGYGRPLDVMATDYANSQDKGMIFELRRNPRHWVLLHQWGSYFSPTFWPFMLVMDPLKGKFVRIRKSEISGYATFQKK